MSDSIAELGLDTKGFDAAIDRAVDRIKSLAVDTVTANANMVTFAATIGVALTAAFIESTQRAKELEETIKRLESTDPFNSQLVSLKEYQERLKAVSGEIKKLDEQSRIQTITDFVTSSHLLGGSGYDSKLDEQDAQKNRLLEQQDHALKGIAEKEAQSLEVLELRNAGDEEEAKLLENHLKWQEKINEARNSGNADLAATLAKEENVTAEKIKQDALAEKEKQRVTSREKESERINKMARDAITSLEKEQKQKEDADERAEKASIKREKDAADELIEKYKKLGEVRKESAKNEEEAIRKENNLRRIARENQNETRQTERGNANTAIAQSGNTRTANLTKISGDYAERIRQANIKDPTGKLAAAIEQERDMAERDAKASIQQQTPSERRSEERQEQKQNRDASRLDKQDEENWNRALKGQRSAAIDRSLLRRGLKEADKQLGDSGKVAGKDEGGFDSTDKSNLQKIADKISAAEQ